MICHSPIDYKGSSGFAMDTELPYHNRRVSKSCNYQSFKIHEHLLLYAGDFTIYPFRKCISEPMLNVGEDIFNIPLKHLCYINYRLKS